jgi:hypothetical protein
MEWDEYRTLDGERRVDHAVPSTNPTCRTSNLRTARGCPAPDGNGRASQEQTVTRWLSCGQAADCGR